MKLASFVLYTDTTQKRIVPSVITLPVIIGKGVLKGYVLGRFFICSTDVQVHNVVAVCTGSQP